MPRSSTPAILLFTATLAFAAVAAAPAGVRSAVADEAPGPRRNQASLSFMGLAGFLRFNVGSFVLAYERRLDDHHAVRVAGDFVHVHHAADHVQVHQWTFGGTLGYRYHLDPAGGVFVGAEVGYRRGFGHHGEVGGPDHTTLANRQLRVLPEIGVRVPHHRLPLVFVTRIAAGWGPYHVTTERADDVGRAAARYAQDVLAATPLVVEVEASLAFGF